MTTAFILALVAALALAAILFFALNYIRKLERDNVRLAKLWSKAIKNENGEPCVSMRKVERAVAKVLMPAYLDPSPAQKLDTDTRHYYAKKLLDEVRKEADDGVHGE